MTACSVHASSAHQNYWLPEDLAAVRIPESAKRFLAEVGLPTFVADFSFEFGVCDSELPLCVIGVDGEDGIVLDERGAVLIYKADGDETIFVNSSVEGFSRFLHILDAFKRQQHDFEEENKQALKELRESLCAIDAAAMTDDGRRVWPLLVNDMEALWF